MRYLVATDSVHTTAAACDYLDAHADPEDAVTVLTVEEGDGRDGVDALNVATARLAGFATVETERREGDPAEEILAAAGETGADVLVVGARGGRPGASGVGGTARRVVAAAGTPVVVVPLPDLD